MQLDVDCEECGTTFVAKSTRARFCGPTCRVRANRRPTKIGLAKSDAAAATKPKRKTRARKAKAGGKAQVETATEALAQPAPPVYDTLEEQLRASLTRLQALDTISGMAAVRVAQQIDRGRDSGSAVATLSKELSRLVAEAKVEAAPRIRDAADDIADRAAAKIGLVSA